jgi:hypothetical protein
MAGKAYQSVVGSCESAQYRLPRVGKPRVLLALQTDFVWGFLLANPIRPPAVAAAPPTLRAPAPGVPARTFGGVPPAARAVLSRSARERALGP